MRISSWRSLLDRWLRMPSSALMGVAATAIQPSTGAALPSLVTRYHHPWSVRPRSSETASCRTDNCSTRSAGGSAPCTNPLRGRASPPNRLVPRRDGNAVRHALAERDRPRPPGWSRVHQCRRLEGAYQPGTRLGPGLLPSRGLRERRTAPSTAPVRLRDRSRTADLLRAHLPTDPHHARHSERPRTRSGMVGPGTDRRHCGRDPGGACAVLARKQAPCIAFLNPDAVVVVGRPAPRP